MLNLLIFLFIYFYIFYFDLLDLAKNGSCSWFVPNVQSCRSFNQLLLLVFKAYLSINHKLNFTFSFICALLYTMKKQNKLDKKTRARLRELARVESVYNLTGTASTYRGFSIYSGMSTRSSSINKSNSYQNRLARFIDTGRSQKIYN